MNFKNWILKNGLKPKTANHYASAVYGSISEWAMKAGLIDTSLIEISSPKDFKIYLAKLKSFPFFNKEIRMGIACIAVR